MASEKESCRDRALRILRILEERRTSEKRTSRLLECLADFEDGFAAEWAFAVPSAFRPALDIKRTERVVGRGETKQRERIWSQGGAFDFHEGDLFYDHRSAVEADTWEEALQEVSLCLQVMGGPDARPDRVVFDLYRKDPEERRLTPVGRGSLSPSEFVRVLIQGTEAMAGLRFGACESDPFDEEALRHEE